MQKFGGTLVLLGVLAIVMNYLNMVPRVLMWIYAWGEGTALFIKIGLIVLGGILWLIGKKQSN